MELSVQEYVKRIVVVRPTGRIDAFSAPQLRARLEALMADGVVHFVIDLAAVDFLDSAGMAVLVSALKRSRLAGGDVKLVWPQSADGRRILMLTRFDRVFEMVDSAESAVTL